MLGHFIGNLLRNLFGSRQGEGADSVASREMVREEAGKALAAFLRAPPGHPKTLDYELVAYLQAAATSAEYMTEHMMEAQNLVHADALLEFALRECTVEGLVLEFGVYRGGSLRRIAALTTQQVHGFDSFEGLPDDWTYLQKKGRFSLDGKLPAFEEANIRLHPGWFRESLPPFLIAHPGAVRFAHIDCDLYDSTRVVLECLRPRIVAGSVMVFDEYLNYPGWQRHEFRAFREFIASTRMSYRYLGFASSACAVALQIV